MKSFQYLIWLNNFSVEFQFFNLFCFFHYVQRKIQWTHKYLGKTLNTKKTRTSISEFRPDSVTVNFGWVTSSFSMTKIIWLSLQQSSETLNYYWRGCHDENSNNIKKVKSLNFLWDGKTLKILLSPFFHNIHFILFHSFPLPKFRLFPRSFSNVDDDFKCLVHVLNFFIFFSFLLVSKMSAWR